MVSMLGLVWTGIQQVSVNRNLAMATAIEARRRNELVEGAHQFDEVRHANNKALIGIPGRQPAIFRLRRIGGILRCSILSKVQCGR